MNIREALVKEHSKRNTMAIVDFIGEDKERFAELIDVFNTSDYRLVQRAAWPISYIAERAPGLLSPHWKTLFKLIDTNPHPAYKRNLLRTLRMMDEIPTFIHSKVIDVCFQAIPSVHEPAAVRAFAIHIMGKLCKVYPELANELSMMLEVLTDHELPSIRSSARNVLKMLSKISK